MGQFIEQFFHGLQLWSQKTTSSDEIIRQIILADLGKYDESQDIEFNLDLVEKRVEMLVEDVHLSEHFLVTALIREIEQVLEDQLEDAEKGEYSKEVIHARQAKKRMLEKVSDQERQSPSFQKHLSRLEQFERSIFPTPEKIAMQKLLLSTWREIMRSILHRKA